MQGLFLSEMDPPAIGQSFWMAFKNQRLTSSGVSLCHRIGVILHLYKTFVNAFVFDDLARLETGLVLMMDRLLRTVPDIGAGRHSPNCTSRHLIVPF